MIEDARYVSVWDDGSVSFESPCGVDLADMRVVAMDAIDVAYEEEGDVYDPDEIALLENSVDVLDKEYVELPDGRCFTVGDPDEVFDEYGNGVIWPYEH